MPAPWRLIVDGDAPGTFNMGVDEALLATALEEGTPTLRFYTWQGAWLSLGYAQPLNLQHVQRLEEAGVGWVRRATGGRAVLHGADLTYAIAAPEEVLPAGVRASYGVVADALLEALHELGVPATRTHPGPQGPSGPGFDCFETPAADEICLGGKKLSGSAQRRVGGAFLQHGSIRLGPDPAQAVVAVAPGPGGLAGTSLAEEGIPLSREVLEQACMRAISQRLGAALEPSSLSLREQSHARERGPESPPSVRHPGPEARETPPDSWGKPPQERLPSTR